MINRCIQLRGQVAQTTRFCTMGAQYLWAFSMALASPLAPKIFNRLKNLCTPAAVVIMKTVVWNVTPLVWMICLNISAVCSGPNRADERVDSGRGRFLWYLRSYLPTTPYPFPSNGNLQLKLVFYIVIFTFFDKWEGRTLHKVSATPVITLCYPFKCGRMKRVVFIIFLLVRVKNNFQLSYIKCDERPKQ